MKYFPDKPADVNCGTCPYAIKHHTKTDLIVCSRHPDGNDMGRYPDKSWCGEHPWFVQQRTLQQMGALSDVLADRFHDLAQPFKP